MAFYTIDKNGNVVFLHVDARPTITPEVTTRSSRKSPADHGSPSDTVRKKAKPPPAKKLPGRTTKSSTVPNSARVLEKAWRRQMHDLYRRRNELKKLLKSSGSSHGDHSRLKKLLDEQRRVQASIAAHEQSGARHGFTLGKAEAKSPGMPRASGNLKPAAKGKKPKPTPIKGVRRSSSVRDKERIRDASRRLSEELDFGDKYLGHVRRESDGSFGSLPLYDDYGEESSP